MRAAFFSSLESKQFFSFISFTFQLISFTFHHRPLPLHLRPSTFRTNPNKTSYLKLHTPQTLKIERLSTCLDGIDSAFVGTNILPVVGEWKVEDGIDTLFLSSFTYALWHLHLQSSDTIMTTTMILISISFFLLYKLQGASIETENKRKLIQFFFLFVFSFFPSGFVES